VSNVLDRLKKKRGTSVTINDDQFRVRSLTIGELKRLDAVIGDERTGFVLGCALLADDDSPAVAKADSESDSDWSKRVLTALEDVPSDTIRQLSDAIGNLGKTPTAEAVRKN